MIDITNNDVKKIVTIHFTRAHNAIMCLFWYNFESKWGPLLEFERQFLGLLFNFKSMPSQKCHCIMLHWNWNE